MSIEAVSWALRVPIGGSAKVMLLGLANHAHPDGTEAFPSLDTLAEYGACDRSTARRNVRKLVELGWAIEDGLGPKGQTKYRLPVGASSPVGGGKVPPVADGREGGGNGDAGGVAPVPPEPSIEPSSNRQKEKSARASSDEWPEDLDEQLHEPALAAGKILKRTALARGQRREVTRAAVGRAVAAYPDRDHVEVARDVEAWLMDGNGATQPCADVVGRFRRFLKTSQPMPGPAMLPRGVTAIRPTQMSGAAAQRAELLERVREQGA